MARTDELWRYDGRRAVVTGCASGIGAEVARLLTELGAEVVGLDQRDPALQLKEFHRVNLADPASIDGAVTAIGGQVDSMFNVAGVSSGIGDPLLVTTINFLGMRHLTEALVPAMPPGSAIACVSSLAAVDYLQHRSHIAGLLRTRTFDEGLQWCHRHPEQLADGGYRLSKESIILYCMESAAPLGARGVRINCTAPGVTDTPILDQLRTAYGPEYLHRFTNPLGRVSEPAEQAAVLVFLNSPAASYITGQVLWVDGGSIASRIAGDISGGE